MTRRARNVVRWFSRGSIADRAWWRTQGGYRRVAWLSSGESSTQNRTRVPARPRFPLLARVSWRYACTALQTAIRPTYNMFMYRRATLTLQFMRALTGPQPLGLLSVLVLRIRRRLARLTRPRIYQRGSTCKFTHRRRAEHHVCTVSLPFCTRKPAFVGAARYLYFCRCMYMRCLSFSACLVLQTGRRNLEKLAGTRRGRLARNGTNGAFISRVRVFREDRNGQARTWRTCGQV